MSAPEYFTRLLGDRVWVGRGLAAAILLGGTAVLLGVKAVIRRRLTTIAPTTENRWDDFLADLVGRTSAPFLVALAGLAAITLADVGASIERFVRTVALMICLVQAGMWGSRAMRELIERRFEKAGLTDDPVPPTVFRVVILVSAVAMVSVGYAC